MNPVTKTFQYGGQTVTLETGRIARQATGAVMVTVENTSVLCTVVAEKSPREGRDFFPLAVDGDKSTATWSTQPDNIDPGHLAIGFLQSQDINRIRLWKDCADPALYLWHGNKRALTLFILGAGGIATGIIIWKIIKDDDPASPS